MRVELDGGGVIDLGVTETTPTIGITDYSRRVTDDFGVTTVVERSFARRMSIRFALGTDKVDAVQRQFAALRATPARWVAHDSITSLSIRGFYKDFSLDIPGQAVSFCTLSVEGLTETVAGADAGGDPAPAGQASTLRLLQPIAVTDAILSAINVAENDYPAWAEGTTYAQNARVIRAHRVFVSVAGGNIGHDPSAAPEQWLDIGPTNRWAMFDQALGTTTTGTGQITLTLNPANAINGLALLDTDAGLIRVQAPGYDRTQLRGGEHPEVASVLFLDLVAAAGAAITITIGAGGGAGTPRVWNDAATWVDASSWQDFNTATGTGPVSVGTLLLGNVVSLGITEASPTAAITDFSRKDVDEFGEATIVERAWAKTMSARALIRSDAVDAVFARIAAVRARPSLWIGSEALDSLTIYGFFKDFGIEVGPSVSTLSLSVEGLSKAAPASTGAIGEVSWPDVTDPTGTKPTDNADVTGDNTSKDTGAVGGKPAGEVLGELAAAEAWRDTFEQQTLPAITAAQATADAQIAAASGRITTAQSAADAAKTRADGALGRAEAAFTEIGTQATRLDQRIDSVVASGGYDDTAVYAEVSRVDSTAIGRDVALSQSIQSVSANLTTTDGSLRALVTTKEQAAVDRETAISQSVQAVSANLITTDTSLRALVTTKETAAIDRENAISQRVSTIEAGGGGGGGEGVDSFARSEVSRVEQASITRDTALGSRVDTVTASIGPAINAKAQEITTAYAAADLALAMRTTALETTTASNSARIGTVETATTDGRFATAQRASTIEAAAGQLAARVAVTETATTDGRFATAQRASTIEAAAGQLAARVTTTETATTDGRFASASTVQTLQSDYNGTKATVTQQAGTIVGLGQRTAAYWQVQAVAGDGRALLRVVADANGGGGVQIGGDLLVDGNVLVTGSVFTNSIAPNAINNVLSSTSASSAIPYSASISAPADGLSVTLPAPSGQTVRIDFATSALVPFNYQPPGSPYPPTVYYSLWRRQNGVNTQIRPWEPGSLYTFLRLSLAIEAPPAGAPATYLIRYYFDATGGGSLSIGEQQMIVTEIKR